MNLKYDNLEIKKLKIMRHGMIYADKSNTHMCGYKFDAEGQIVEGRDLVKAVLEYLLKAIENEWMDLEFTCNEVENARGDTSDWLQSQK